MTSPTLSVVMPNYNHSQFLPRAIESVIEQTRPPDEFLILDDASTDDSLQVMESYAAQHNWIRVLRNHQNQGVVRAHDRLYKMAAGDYLYSAAADDDRHPWFFERAMEMAERHPQAGVIFGKMEIIDRDDQLQGVIESSRWDSPQFVTPERFLAEYLEVETPMHSATAATIFRRDAFAEVGWCREELGSFADTFAVRAIALKHGACYVPEPLSRWRRMPESFSRQTGANLQRALDITARAAALMRSEPFRDRFPADYVARWRRRQKRQILWSYWLGEEIADGSPRPSRWVRNWRRLPRLGGVVRALFYRGDATSDAC